MQYHKIPDETIRRLPLYWRGLHLISKEQTHISSQDLASIININSWQIRKDLSFFGTLGIRGTGYDVKRLSKEIGNILKLNGTQKAVLVGAGNLGTALLKYTGFESYGFKILEVFDIDNRKIGREIHHVVVEDILKLRRLKNDGISIGIITVPVIAAQDVADELVKVGICGILNFAPINLIVPKKVTVINIDIALELARLPYYMPARLAGNRTVSK